MTGSAAWPYPRWIAHRGAGKLAPENTLAAFRLGAAHGYRMFECDVKLSADGEPFLLHDDTLERTSNGQGQGGALRWAELSRLDAGGWHSRAYAGEPPPTLAAIAAFCHASGFLLDLEIKPTTGSAAETGGVVAEAAARLWQGCDIPPLLTSFQVDALRTARQAAPELPRGLLLDRLWDGWLDAARDLGCAAVVCQHALWTLPTVAEARSAGLRLLCYTVNEPAESARLLALGIDGIVTDRVDLFSPSEPRDAST